MGYVVKIKNFGFLHLFCSTTFKNELTVGVDIYEDRTAQKDKEYLNWYEKEIETIDIRHVKKLWYGRQTAGFRYQPAAERNNR